MFLATKDGIICDLCGQTYKENFTYYSPTMAKIAVINNFKTGSEMLKQEIDFCEKCYSDLLDEVRKNIGKFKPGHIKCDLSDTYKSGTFHYHYIEFDKVAVNKNSNPPTSIDKRVMDLSIIDGFDKILEKAQVTRKKIQQQGQWS